MVDRSKCDRGTAGRRGDTPAAIEPLEARRLMASSGLVVPAADGHLLYTPDAEADRIPDFSNVGYRGGTVPLPTVAVKATVSPGSGDDAARIQAAIDQVSDLPLGADGFRGAVLLRAGEFEIGGSVFIRDSGVVLRGEGDGTNGTVLRATGTSQRTLVQVIGSGSRQTVSGTTHSITDKVVPVGARTFRVDSTAGLAAGDKVIVNRPSTADWLRAIDADDLANPWVPGTKDQPFDRVITRIEGDQVTIDAPLANSLERRFGGGTIFEYRWPGRIQNVGVENLRGRSDFSGSTDENHSWTFIGIEDAENVWVRDITGQHFAYAAVSAENGAKWVTVTDSECLDPVSQITGSRRYSFNVDSQLTLVKNCYSRLGRHDYVLGSSTPGPNAFVDSRGEDGFADAGPHQRWSTGGLFDNIDVEGTGINVQNRGNSGSGHGWAGANMVIWNSTSDGGYIVQNPPTAQNWLIGSTGAIKSGTMYVGPRPEQGVTASHGTAVEPRSLYAAQLQDRLRHPGGSDREYWLGDADSFAAGDAQDAPPVDAAWRNAVTAAMAGGQRIVGFDNATGNTWVPSSFRFALSPGERVVAASVSLGLRRTGGTGASDTSRVYLDSLDQSYPFASLGWSPESDETSGVVLDLTGQLAALGDGLLNVAVAGNAAVDWAVLNLRVAPQDPSVPAAVVGRRVFYNGSAHDAGPAGDDGAVAPDKQALLPGGRATPANYTSYSRGINGVMLDIRSLPSGTIPVAGDFQFRVGTTGIPAGWPAATPPSGVTVRRGAGTGGSDRVTITWPDGAITNRWLQVTVPATTRTGLSAPDVFYFGNLVGDTADDLSVFTVNSQDVARTRNAALDAATLATEYDHDRSGRTVNSEDMVISRNAQRRSLPVLSAPGTPAGQSETTTTPEPVAPPSAQVPATPALPPPTPSAPETKAVGRVVIPDPEQAVIAPEPPVLSLIETRPLRSTWSARPGRVVATVG